MSKVTKKDLQNEVKDLNKRFKKSKNSAVMFDIHSAYGGNQIVLKDNKTGAHNSITYGYGNPREVINQLNDSRTQNSLPSTVNITHRRAMDRRKKK